MPVRFDFLIKKSNKESGQSMVEYALIAALVILALIAIFSTGVAGNISRVYDYIKNNIFEALG